MTRGHGAVRRSQIITTWGPAAMLDPPRHAGFVGGLETWPNVGDLEEIVDQRLTQKLALMSGIVSPKLYAPPLTDPAPGAKARGIGVWRFPEWFLVQEKSTGGGTDRSRRIVQRK